MNDTLRNIEFFVAPDGQVMVSDAEGLRSYTMEERALTSVLFERIETEYPEAMAALQKHYRGSAANVPYFRYLICHRFVRCNFGAFDRRIDVDGAGRFLFEEVSCPLHGECPYDGVICGAKFDTHLTARQKEVMKLYMEGLSDVEVAEQLFISPATALTTRKHAFRKAGVHSLAEFVAKFKDHL
uniref:helix-turn-helix domain-containing protein n=1 Tax=Alistipes sp. TaxID=1872444 RepID=UPI004055ED6B